jgi:hypothetical protein
MTAPELIAILKAHPKACGRLRLECVRYDDGRGEFVLHDTGNSAIRHRKILDTLGSPNGTNDFRLWLIGACVEWCDSLRINAFTAKRGRWFDNRHNHYATGNGLPTRLHAMLAAIEAAEETT